jgi:hypothetical protein
VLTRFALALFLLASSGCRREPAAKSRALLSPSSATSAVQPPAPAERAGSSSTIGRFYASKTNVERGAPPEPLVYFGDANDFGAKFIAENSTFNCLAVDTLDDLEAVLGTTPCGGLVARSPRDAPGSAGRAIALFRRVYADREPVFYLPWGLNVARAAARAFEYGADAILISGMLANEELGTILDALRRVKTGEPRPGSVAAHIENLKRTTPQSPFWQMQDVPPEQYLPGRYYDPERFY